jgi:hypothetical protein
MNVYFQKKLHWIITLLIPLFIFSCTEVRLIGAYDPTIDQSIQKISKDVSTLLIEIEKNHLDGKTADNTYDNFRKRYIDIEGETQTLKIRSNALPKYKIISSQVDLLDQNVKLLDSLHKTGFTAPGANPVPVITHVKQNFETAFTAMLALQNGLKREKVGKNQ